MNSQNQIPEQINARIQEIQQKLTNSQQMNSQQSFQQYSNQTTCNHQPVQQYYNNKHRFI